MISSLTPPQTSLLRRIAGGMGLPAYVLRPRTCAQDVETLCGRGLLAAAGDRLSITNDGASLLHRIDAVATGSGRGNMQVSGGLDRVAPEASRPGPP